MNIPKCSILVFALISCGSEPNNGFGGGGKEDPLDSASIAALPESEDVWQVTDRGFDLTSSNGLLYASTQAGGAIWTFDPVSAEENKLAWDLGDIQAITVSGAEIHAAFTDSHVEGWVATIDPPKDVGVIASQTDSGVLFRRPAGLAYGDNGEIYALDTKAEAVWKLDSSGAASTFFDIGGVAIFFFENTLYVGGDDGIFEVTGNSTTLVDSRVAFGFGIVEGELVASNTTEFVFLVGGSQIATGNLARPGAMATLNGVLYIMDTVTGIVSAVNFE